MRENNFHLSLARDLSAISNFLCTRCGELKAELLVERMCRKSYLHELWIEANLKFIELIRISHFAPKKVFIIFAGIRVVTCSSEKNALDLARRSVAVRGWKLYSTCLLLLVSQNCYVK